MVDLIAAISPGSPFNELFARFRQFSKSLTFKFFNVATFFKSLIRLNALG